MVKEGLTREFNLKSQNPLVEVSDVVLHHALEADVGGRIRQHVWVTAKAAPKIARETLDVDIDFILWAGEDRLGACGCHALRFGSDSESLDFIADSDVRIEQNMQVARLEIMMSVTLFDRFAGIDVEPAPFDPIKKPRIDRV